MKFVDADRMCHRKHRFWTATKAKQIAERCAKKRGVRLRIYQCPFCLGYHLTSMV